MSSKPTRESKNWRPVVVILLGALTVALLWLLRQNVDRPIAEAEGLPRIGTTNVGGEVGTNGFRVLSDDTTSTGRVVWVERDGQQMQLLLPANVAMTAADLEAFAFDEPAPPKEGNPEAILTRRLAFYGLTVDGDSNAVAGVDVEASVLVVSPAKHEGYKAHRAVSGADGRFVFDVPWGQQITIRPSKDGHVTPPEETFIYGPVGVGPRHRPDPLNPIVFALHRKREPEPLFSFEKVFFAPPSGEPIHIDLTTATIVPTGGDLIVSAYCSEPFTNLKNFGWSLGVEVVGGGLVEVNIRPRLLQNLPEAPVEGYQLGFAVEHGPDLPNYDRQHESLFYLRSRNGQVHAKVRFDMNTRWGQRGVPIIIAAVVNTNSSRYLHTEP